MPPNQDGAGSHRGQPLAFRQTEHSIYHHMNIAGSNFEEMESSYIKMSSSSESSKSQAKIGAVSGKKAAQQKRRVRREAAFLKANNV
jgi:hypothetical protein